jgi:hypothetical protein
MSFRRRATVQPPTTWAAAAVAKSESWPIVVSEYVLSSAASFFHSTNARCIDCLVFSRERKKKKHPHIRISIYPAASFSNLSRKIQLV